MLSTNTKLIALSVVATATLLVGCGNSSTEGETSGSISGQLVDSYIEGATYKCEDGKEALTGKNGEFSCDRLPVEFRLKNLNLGKIEHLAEDKHVFPQDLIGVDRNNTEDTRVVAMAQLLQSLDSDSNPENGITLDKNILEKINSRDLFDSEQLATYIADAGVSRVDAKEARDHLDRTMKTRDTINKASLPKDITDALSSVQYVLSEDVKNDLAYMGNEERLAYDIYNKLYLSFPDLQQFDKIPTKSEIKHIEAVKALVVKYGINGEELSITDVESDLLSPQARLDLVAGTYDITAIQDLYNTLLAKGEQSAEDALQVGCMVEVTDIDDLDKYIVDAIDSEADDVLRVFNFLRDGSYNHYWAFDKGLKNLGVENGCCSAGDAYCKTVEEYPQQERGGHSDEQTRGEGRGHGGDENAQGKGEGRQHGRS